MPFTSGSHLESPLLYPFAGILMAWCAIFLSQVDFRAQFWACTDHSTAFTGMNVNPRLQCRNCDVQCWSDLRCSVIDTNIASQARMWLSALELVPDVTVDWVGQDGGTLKAQ